MKKKQKAIFANIIIACCLLISFAITAAVIGEYHRLNTVIPSGVLGALLGLWGGELLIIALRQIFGSDVVTKTKSKSFDNYKDESI